MSNEMVIVQNEVADIECDSCGNLFNEKQVDCYDTGRGDAIYCKACANRLEGMFNEDCEE